MLIRSFIVLVMLAFVPALAAKVSSEPPLIAIASGKDAKPYQQVIEGFKQAVSKAQPNIQFVDSNKVSKTMGLPSMVFALGSGSVKQSYKDFADTHLLATMVLNDEAVQSSEHATAVMLQTSIQSQLQWYQRVLPKAKRIGILYDPNINQEYIDKVAKQANKLGMEVIPVAVESAKELPSALKFLGRNADSILGIADKTVYSAKTAKTVLLYSFRNRIPFVGISAAWVKAGALYALDWDYESLGRQCADIALKIMGGTPANKIKPSLPEKLTYQINVKTARHMKLELDKQLIAGATKVYK